MPANHKTAKVKATEQNRFMNHPLMKLSPDQDADSSTAGNYQHGAYPAFSAV